ncbi:MAG: dienelactone hydrolase family protein [Acidobacteriaceae bacterium]
MAQHTQLQAADGHKFDAYIAQPTGEPKAGIVVLQEIFGVTAHIRSMADGFSQAGYLAIAPALFDRVERNVELTDAPESTRKGMHLAQQIKPDQALADIDAAIQYLREHGAHKVGVVGYCWGGTYAWLSNTRLHPDATVSYYPGRIADHLHEKPAVPAMFHFGLLDKNIPQTLVEDLRKTHPQLPIFTYEAGHAFNNDTRASYNETAAKQARQRTLAHLDEHLVGRSHQGAAKTQ